MGKKGKVGDGQPLTAGEDGEKPRYGESGSGGVKEKVVCLAVMY